MTAQRALDPGDVRSLVIAGWTGRDAAALERHIRELEAIGVKRPRRTPIFYRVAAALLTVGNSIEVLGGHSSGDVECVLYSLDDGVWIGVGSDHTDRRLETVGVGVSKQMCAKPVGKHLWRYDDVAPHWDRLTLRSFVRVGGRRKPYQDGQVAAMRRPDELIRLFAGEHGLSVGTAMFCGTLAANGGIEPGDSFEMELEDPVLGRKLEHRYEVVILPDDE